MTSSPDHEPDAPALLLLAETLPVAAPDPRARKRLLDALQGAERFAPFAAEVARHFGVDPGAALTALRSIDDESAWRAGPWPGSRILLTEAMSEARALIAVLPPEMRIARHDHHARELTFVLEGELCSDQTAHGVGSLLLMLPGSSHTVTVGDRGPCLVVFSATGPNS